MEIVEPAGTPEFETCPTHDTDEEEASHSYLFTLWYDEDGPHFDTFLDASLLTTTECSNAVVGARAVEKLTGKRTSPTYTFDAAQKALLQRIYYVIHIRHRVQPNLCGPYLLKTSFEMDPDEVMQYLRSMTTEARKAFLEGAKF